MVTFKAFLQYSVPCVKWNTEHISTTGTTAPSSKPRNDELLLSLWTDFVTGAAAAADKLEDLELEDNPLFQFKRSTNSDFVISCEEEMTHAFSKFIGEPLTIALDSYQPQNRYRVSPKNINVLLQPDLCLFNLVGDDEKRLVAVIEAKTPWSFNIPDGDLVSAFEREKKLAAKQSCDDPTSSSRNDTKVLRVVSQIWGYLSVNHLKYGVLTTFSHTYFFRRLDSSSSAKSEMQVTPAISLDRGLVPIFTAWNYFVSLLKTDFLYSSPFSSPTLSRKLVRPKANRYEHVSIDLAQLFFEKPFAFGASANVTTGRVEFFQEELLNMPSKSYIFKVFDGSKDLEARSLFEREIFAYERLESLQGHVVPRFLCPLVASGFVFILVLEKIDVQRYDTWDISENQVKAAFNKIHSLGVIHNDVAKRNVLAQRNEFRIIDFGRALFRATLQPTGLSHDVFLDEQSFEQAAREELDQVTLLKLPCFE
jgi:hypothetical protein